MSRPRSGCLAPVILAGCVASLAALSWAQAPVPPAPPSVPLTLTGSPAAVATVVGGKVGKVQWVVVPDAKTVEAGQSLVVLDSGTFVVLAIPDGGSVLRTTVAVGSGIPGPGPVTPPLPVPVVPPNGGAASPVWALAVFDTSQQISLPPGQLALYKSQTIVASLKAIGVTYRHYDVADPAVTGSTWGQACLELQKPALVLWRGKTVVQGWPVNLPANESDLVGLVKGAVDP